MNLNQIYYFNELAKQHQFSKAAKHLHISQPSLSNSIKSLEKEINCKLIERKNGRIELTKYGQIFFEATRSIILILKKTEYNINYAKRLENNTVEIGCIPTALKKILPYIISKFKDQSNLSFNFVPHSAMSKDICKQLNEKNYDIGICSKIEKYPNLKFIPLYNENTSFTCKVTNSKIEFPENTRTIYLVYNVQSALPQAAKELITFLTAK